MTLTPVLLFDTPVYAGSSFSTLSQVTNVVKVKDAKELAKIMEQIRIAKAKSAHALSREEIEKIRMEAEQIVANQSGMVVQPGAAVFVCSQVIE